MSHRNMDQTMKALASANVARAGKASLKAAWAAEERTLQEVLGSPLMKKVIVLEVFTCLPRWGSTRAERLLSSSGGLNGWREVGKLTERERRLLLAAWARDRAGEKPLLSLSKMLDAVATCPGLTTEELAYGNLGGPGPWKASLTKLAVLGLVEMDSGLRWSATEKGRKAVGL